MKIIIRLLSALIIISWTSCICEESDSGILVPDCVQTLIDKADDEDVVGPPREIWRWTTSLKTYYYVVSECCDHYNNLYDTNCNLICAPDGGFAGSGSGDCPELPAKISKTLIWKWDGQ